MFEYFDLLSTLTPKPGTDVNQRYYLVIPVCSCNTERYLWMGAVSHEAVYGTNP